MMGAAGTDAVADGDRIQPSVANPSYWQHRGEPVLVLGGSVEDNLFQIPQLERHLDLLAAVGGNYVGCTMESRDPGDAWPFERDRGTGLSNLAVPSSEYWGRFEYFLELTAERYIIGQVEGRTATGRPSCARQLDLTRQASVRGGLLRAVIGSVGVSEMAAVRDV